MEMKLFLRRGPAVLVLLCIMSLCLLASPEKLLGAASFPGTPYCSVPPMPGSGVKPNLLLMIDNSASMYDLAYTDPSAYCVDDSYKNDISYIGYFNQNAIYGYDGVNLKFVPGATLPSPPCSSGSCAASTNYLYVEMAGVPPNRTVRIFKASGNFLNWLSASKLDLEKQVLTGGKFKFDANGTSGMLLAETRGCQGKRFVKIAADAPQITFGVRGPITSDSDFVNGASHGGGTRIEIFDKHYNKEDCLAAVRDWQNGSPLTTLVSDAGKCVGKDSLCEDVPPPIDPAPCLMPSRNKVFVDITSACYAYPTSVLGHSSLLADCTARLQKYQSDPARVPKGAGDDICAKDLNHALTSHVKNGIIISDSKGFLGNCYTLGSGQGSGFNYPANPCVEVEAEDYCREITNPALTDPWSSTNQAGTNMNVPSYILDGGIYSLGPVSGTFLARASAPAAPTGLIQEFGNDINFGAMIFNGSGASSECKQENLALVNGGIVAGDIPCIKTCKKNTKDSGRECHLDADCAVGYRCQASPLADGGKIISAIKSPLGDHPPSTGLIASIDQVTADAWTPLAESLYVAIGYFGNLADPRPGTHLWPPSAGSYGTPPSQFNCQRNNILIVSDGVSTADRHPDVSELLASRVAQLPPSMTTNVKAGDDASPPAFQGSYNLDDLAWLARNVNTANFSKEAVNNLEIVNKKDYLSTYVIYTGVPCSSRRADGTCDTTDETVPEKMMQLTADKGGGGKIAKVETPADMEKAFRDMLQQIAAGSGTAPSILSTGDGNGAIFLQNQFYPTKSFDGGATSASWIGEMQSLWYYIDPFLGGTNGAGSTIREDTDVDLKLNLKKDRVVNFLDTGASVFTDADADGKSDDGVTQPVSADALKSLWRAGMALWQRSAADRTIYTQTNGSTLTDFNAIITNPKAAQLLQARDATEAQQIISYVTGVDNPAYRNRTLTMAVPGVEGVQSHVWKLGDIVSSSPKVQSSALNSYHLRAPGGYNDLSYRSFIGSNEYLSRSSKVLVGGMEFQNRGGTVYVGANDGTLHAFNLGKLDSRGSGDVKASLGGLKADLGKEQWAFIPRNVLPYLTYLKEPGYKHLHYLDGAITLADMSIGDTNAGDCVKASYWNCEKQNSVVKDDNSPDTNSLDPAKNTWRTVLIGGMGLGGASGAPGPSCVAGTDCVQTPIADPADPLSSKRLGYSSYYALDVTDPDHPALLWEFTDPGLGYSTTGPAIVRIGDPKKNGRWFAVFGSGPTGPIDPATQQFWGRSNQELQLLVVDLRTGELVTTLKTGILNAFAGVMSGASIDADRWRGSYQDDALYAGYSKMKIKNGLWTGSWTGGVLRVLTNENQDPKQWLQSIVVDGIGPVTSGIAKIQDRKYHKLWLYFGTGRYFFNQDDMQDPRALYGVKEPCYNAKELGVDKKRDWFNDPHCTANVQSAELSDQTLIQHPLTPDDPGPGWLIGLDHAVGAVGTERLTANPTSITGGAVFFTTFQPSTDPCLFGNTYLWGVQYYSGGYLAEGSLQGKALVALSTGAVQESDLSQKLADKGGRRSGPLPGRPGGVKIVSNSGLRPLKKIIHLQER